MPENELKITRSARTQTLEDELKITRLKLEHQTAEDAARTQTLEDELKITRLKLEHQTAKDAARAQMLEDELKITRLKFAKQSESAIATCPSEISTRVEIRPGDYFFPCTSDLRQKATEVKMIGKGTFGTVWQVVYHIFLN
jgi:hypothetical protein